MKRFLILMAAMLCAATAAHAQFNLKKAIGAGVKSVQAAKLSDSQLGGLGESLLHATYSQKQERDADNYGYDFLKKHGVNPWAMAISFEKLRQMQAEMGGDKTSKVQQLFSTHPDIKARSEAMAARAEADGFKRP